jgi:4-methyl-5(b-hydroxyethyl)-thiazole monophosphate biosynthesis
MNNAKRIVRALLCAANGSEEIETVNIANVLVRGGINVIIAKVFDKTEINSNDLTIKCARGMRLIADKPFEDCKGEDWDVIVLPGGKLGAVICYLQLGKPG